MYEVQNVIGILRLRSSLCYKLKIPKKLNEPEKPFV
jgi:hypothetical protein